jgi:putative transposase
MTDDLPSTRTGEADTPFDPMAFLEAFFASHVITESAKEQVRRALCASPDRIIRPGLRNTPAVHPSDKTGESNVVESALEQGAAIILDGNDQVLYWVAQPAFKLRVTYRDARGKKVTIWTNPDFLVAMLIDGQAELVFIEVKPESILAKWSETTVDRVEFIDGSYRSRPAEAVAAAYGARYEFMTERTIPVDAVRNALLISDFVGASQSILPETVEAIRSTIGQNIGISLRELTRRHPPDQVLALIADKVIWADLANEPYHSEGRGRLFLNRSIAESHRKQVAPVHFAESPPVVVAEDGRAVRWNGKPFRIIVVTHEKISLQDEIGGSVIALPSDEFERLAVVGDISSVEDAASDWVAKERERRMRRGPKAWDVATRRLQLLEAEEQAQERGSATASATPLRTLTRWRASYRQAELDLGWGMLGLLPQDNVGNRTNHGPADRAELIKAAVVDIYESGESTTILHVYGELIHMCKEKGYDPPAYETVRQAVHKAVIAKQARIRHGSKVGAAEAGPSLAPSIIAPHGSFGWSQAHCDHTLLDIELVDHETGVSLGRPWLTLIIDSYSRAIIGLSLSFDPPSRRSVFRAVRDCIRRHRRLPSMLVLDGGKEFRSRAFETFAMAYRMTIRWRAASNPRFGAEIESLLGGFTKSILHALRGGTKATKNVRQLTKETTPSNRAVWDLLSFAGFVEDWISDVYHARPHPAHHLPPPVRLSKSQEWSGERVRRIVAYSDAFYVATLPEIDGDTRKVDHRTGIKIDNAHYWHTDFALGEVAGKDVAVRQDPDDIRFAYAFVRGRWVRAQAAVYMDLGALSATELAAASAEFDRLVTITGQARAKTAEALAKLLRTARGHESVALARRKAAAERAAIERSANGTKSANSTPLRPSPTYVAADEVELPELFADDEEIA